MKVYIPTSDPSNHILKIFAYFFNKYWSEDVEVKFLGFKDPQVELPDNFEFISLASEQKGGVQQWSTYLREFFQSIDDEFFIFACDDHLLVRPVDQKLFEEVKWTAINLNNVGRFDLTASIQHAQERKGSVFPYKENRTVLELAQYSSGKFIYRITGQWSIWNRQYFLRYMQPGWRPADWEIVGGRMAEGDGWKILG